MLRYLFCVLFISNIVFASPKVGIIMGSQSDLEVMKGAASVLKEFQVPYEMTIVSAHRTPDRMFEYATSARKRGLKIIIAGAGGAAHLPGMTAAKTTLPVVGVPVRGRQLQGEDSLLSIVQMPRGVPVATVAINNSENAALLALRILSVSDMEVENSLEKYRNSQESLVLEQAKVLGQHSELSPSTKTSTTRVSSRLSSPS